MADTLFITDENLRSMIDRDLAELQGCIEHNLYKSAIIMAGSIIEAILVDYFLTFPPENKMGLNQIEKADLFELVELAANPETNLISETTKNIATVIRNYRNLIHPGVEHRKQITIDKNKANVAFNLVEMIFNEIRENYLKRLGYTSEQAINKIKKDRYSIAIFDQIIKDMSPVERVKLFKSIPKAAFDDYKEQQAFPPDLFEGHELDFVNSLHTLHEMLKPYLSTEYKKSEALKIYEFITSNGTKEEILFFIKFFIKDLDLLVQNQKETIINYILNLIDTDDFQLLTEISEAEINGMGKYLNDDENTIRLFEFLRKRIFLGAYSDEELSSEDQLFLDILIQLLTDIDYSRVNKIFNEPSEMSQFPRYKAFLAYINDSLIPI